MKKLKNFMQNLWNDESGQGTAEYVLLIAIVIAIVVMFKDKIRGAMDKQINAVGDGISGFDPNK